MTDEPQTMAEFMEASGIRVTFAPVPFRPELDRDSAWDAKALHWLCEVRKGATPIWRGFYSAGEGVGHHWAKQGAPLWNRDLDAHGHRRHATRAAKAARALPAFGARSISNDAARALETVRECFHAAGPNPAELLDCLRSDCDGADEPFESWAESLGYDPDSRKAADIHAQCLATSYALRTGLGWSLFARFLEVEPE